MTGRLATGAPVAGVTSANAAKEFGSRVFSDRRRCRRKEKGRKRNWSRQLCRRAGGPRSSTNMVRLAPVRGTGRGGYQLLLHVSVEFRGVARETATSEHTGRPITKARGFVSAMQLREPGIAFGPKTLSCGLIGTAAETNRKHPGTGYSCIPAEATRHKYSCRNFPAPGSSAGIPVRADEFEPEWSCRSRVVIGGQ